MVLREERGTFRFTEHNKPLIVDNQTYTPIDSVSADAAISEANLRSSNTAVRGVISSTMITEKMLREGAFNSADVTEFVVDWRYPFAGKMRIMKYQIGSVKWNDALKVFETDLLSKSERLKNKVGELYGRTCRWNFGDSNCDPSGTLLGQWTRNATITQVINQAKYSVFNNATNNYTYTGGAVSAGMFIDGTLEWLTGLNAGLKFTVKKNEQEIFAGNPNNSYARIELHLPAPSEVQVGDTFSVVAGCNKISGVDMFGNPPSEEIEESQLGNCKYKFDNLINFGGFPFMPTNDRLYMTPFARLKAAEETEE